MRALRITVLGLLLAAPAAAVPPVLPLTLPSGKVLQSEVMQTDADRQMGLMFRNSLPEGRGMLFVFEQDGNYGFWMKNCKFPIDMVWLDADRKVVYLAENVPPCRKDPCPSYGGMQRARYVVEMNAGQARREKVALGQAIGFKLPADSPAR